MGKQLFSVAHRPKLNKREFKISTKNSYFRIEKKAKGRLVSREWSSLLVYVCIRDVRTKLFHVIVRYEASSVNGVFLVYA